MIKATKHLCTYATKEAFIKDYNAGVLQRPYVVVIDSVRNSKGEPLILFSNRLNDHPLGLEFAIDKFLKQK